CRLDFTIHVPRPGGPRQWPTRQRSVSCTRPPGSGTRSAAQSHAINSATSVVIPAIMADVEEVEVVVAHHERATLRVGDVFLKIDSDSGAHRRRGRGDVYGADPNSGGPVAEAARARSRRPPRDGTRPPR